MKKTYLIFCTLMNTSFYISTAEKKIDLNTTWDQLVEIIKDNNQQHDQKCEQIVAEHKKKSNNIKEKHINDNPNDIESKKVSTYSAVELEVVGVCNESLDQIKKETLQKTAEQRALMQQWYDVQKK